MQLQYCDGCSSRIEVEKAVTDGDKVYCHDCAAKLGLGRTTPSASGSRLAAGGRGGAAGSSSRIPVAASGTRLAGSGSGMRPAMRPPSTMRRPLAAPPGRTTPGSSAQPQPAARRVLPLSDTTKVALAAEPITGSPDAVTAAEEASSPGSRRTLARAVMIAGIVLGLTGLILIVRGGKGHRQTKPPGTVIPGAKGRETTAQQVPKTGTREPDKPAQQVAKTQALDKPVQQVSKAGTREPDKSARPKDETGEEVAKPVGPSMLNNSVDIREEMAQREVERLIELDKGGKGNPFEIRKRWEAFASTTYGHTKTGQAAVAERLKTLPAAKARAPDAPAKTQPGLEAKVYEASPEEIKLVNLSVAGLKLRCTKVLPNVDLPDKKSIVALADGREEHILVRVSGYIEAPREGVYSFFSSSDDGSMVYLGDSLIVSNDGAHAMQEAGGPMQYPLQAGKHEYRVDYIQTIAEAGLVLSWSGPGIPKQTIPASAFSH